MEYLLAGITAILLLILGYINWNSNSENVTNKESGIVCIIVFKVAYYYDYTMAYTLIMYNNNEVLSYKLSHNVVNDILTKTQRNEYTKTKYIYDNLLNAFGNKVCSIKSKEAREGYIRDFTYRYNGNLLTV